MKVTRIFQSQDLTAAKHTKLSEIAHVLGGVRTDVWNRFGSIAGVDKSHRDIRDEWMRAGHINDIPARLWKATLSDVIGDISTYRAAAIEKVKKAIFKKYSDKETRKNLCRALDNGDWVNNKYLRRMMRKYFKHGHTSVDNQIVLDTGCYTWFEHNGQGWLSVQGMEKGKRILIPLNTNYPVKGTIRLIVKDVIEVHHIVESEGRPCGTGILGLDKGFTEAFVDSDGVSHGLGLGAQIISHSDKVKPIYQNRSQLRAIAEKNPQKSGNIQSNNLGRKKLNEKKRKHEAVLRDISHKAANTVFDKAECVVVEDLTSPIQSKKDFGKNQQRRLSAWVKGMMAEALENVSARRSASVVLVNAAYTSQTCSRCGSFGNRKGDAFYCTSCGVELHADQNAAKNVLSRRHDPQIGRWTNFKTVKSILIERLRRSEETVPPGLELQLTHGYQPRANDLLTNFA